MKFTGQQFHQGDCQFFRVEGLDLGKLKKVEKRFIAASEQSGSYHAMSGNYDFLEMEDGTVVLDVKETCILNHSLAEFIPKDFDTPMVLPHKDHRHSVVEPGVYTVGIQQRFDPLEGHYQKVKD
jgi:hypothetical protein